MKNTIIVLFVAAWAATACSDCEETGLLLTIRSSTGSANDIEVDQEGVGVLPVTTSEICDLSEFETDVEPGTCLLVPICDSDESELFCLIPFESQDDKVSVTLSREGSEPHTVLLEPSSNTGSQHSSCDEATGAATVTY